MVTLRPTTKRPCDHTVSLPGDFTGCLPKTVPPTSNSSNKWNKNKTKYTVLTKTQCWKPILKSTLWLCTERDSLRPECLIEHTAASLWSPSQIRLGAVLLVCFPVTCVFRTDVHLSATNIVLSTFFPLFRLQPLQWSWNWLQRRLCERHSKRTVHLGTFWAKMFSFGTFYDNAMP